MTGTTEKDRTNEKSKKRLKLFCAALVCLAVLAVFVIYIRMAVTPMGSLSIGPAADPERWKFMLSDGTVISPQDGRLPVKGENALVICETALLEDEVENPLIVVVSVSSDCAFLLNDRLIYSPSGRYLDGGFSSDIKFFGASGQFGLRISEDSRLTMVVQFQGSENRLSRMPKLTFYPSTPHYISQYTGSTAQNAIPAGIYFAIAVVVMGLYFISLYKGSDSTGLILLAVCALAMSLTQTTAFSINVSAPFNTPGVTWLCSVLPQAAMVWMLWYRLRRSLRLILLVLPSLITAAILVLFVAGLGNANWTKLMNTVSTLILPIILLLIISAAVVDALKGNSWLSRFFRYLLFSLPVVLTAWLFSVMINGRMAQDIVSAFSAVKAYHSLQNPAALICSYFVILFFIRAITELIESISRQESEIQTMSLREKYALENLEIMRQSQEETRRQRHELRHHVILLEDMLSKDQTVRAAEYLRSLRSQAESIPSGEYSENMVVNAVAGHYLNLAKTQGIRTEAEIKAGADVPMKDEELCILLTNLLENALEACGKMDASAARFISFRLTATGEHITVSCRNSTDTVLDADHKTLPSSKSDAENHGMGIAAVRRVVEKHCGIMDIGCKDGCFTVDIVV